MAQEWERAQRAQEREAKRLHAEQRSRHVDGLNWKINQRVQKIEGLLRRGLAAEPPTSQSLESPFEVDVFDPGELGKQEPPPQPNAFRVPPLGLRRILPNAQQRHALAVAEANKSFERALAGWEQREAARIAELRQREASHKVHSAEAQAKNVAFRASIAAGDPGAIAVYFQRALEQSLFFDLASNCRLAFVPESKQLVIEREFPPVDVIPPIKNHRYIKTKDQITEVARPLTQLKGLYATLVSQLTLLTLHQIFVADVDDHIETAVFNGYLDTVDRSTGKPIRPCLVTVRTSAEEFEALDLTHVEPALCLKHLGAHVSKSPTELLPVRPIVEFNMVDRRFVDERDVLSGLDQRPNLMELSPGDFENLITNLFTKMGLETRQTMASRDGGVDCVAFDLRPILGGKVVIQAKRYKGTVGVSAVRDLFGTVHNEGASKGILVTTSGYGRASFEFANGKPLQLISGPELLYLLQEHAGISARIEPPDDWVEPPGAALV